MSSTAISENVWWRLLRPHTLTASFVPVCIGTTLALPHPHFRLSFLIFMLAASMLIQCACNMFNEYYDYRRGLDTRDSVGIGGAIVRDGIAPQTVYRLAISCLIVAFLLGLYLSSQTSWWLIAIGFLCMLVAYLYSGGPYPISSTPFGELFAGLFLGVIVIQIAYFIQTASITTLSILASIPSAILIGAILMANNIRDLEEDTQHGRRTLAILLGRSHAVNFLAGMFVLANGLIIAFVTLGMLSFWPLLTLASIPKAATAVRKFRNASLRQAEIEAMIATAQTNTIFGLALSVGLLLQYWFSH
ncbi:MAG: menA [Firmicutes bacterium]|nr:menA [Bacillota bacterium]